MAHVPLDLRLSLREGSVFYFQERTLSSAEAHFHIVVNNPLAQQVLLLTVVTSKIEKVKYSVKLPTPLKVSLIAGSVRPPFRLDYRRNAARSSAAGSFSNSESFR